MNSKIYLQEHEEFRIMGSDIMHFHNIWPWNQLTKQYYFLKELACIHGREDMTYMYILIITKWEETILLEVSFKIKQ